MQRFNVPIRSVFAALLLGTSACAGAAPGPEDSADTAPDTAADSAAVDADRDGWAADVDCDEANAAVNPGAAEVCGNDTDEDCDGLAPGCGPARTFALDGDTPRVYGSAGRGLGGHLATGDLDADGAPDLVASTGIGSDGACGASVAFGPVSGAHDIDEVGARLTAEDVPCWGPAPVVVGDLDGDGTDDVAIGRDDSRDEYTASSIWVGFGPFTRSGANTAATVLPGQGGQQFGERVDVADVTGDGSWTA